MRGKACEGQTIVHINNLINHFLYIIHTKNHTKSFNMLDLK